MNKYDYDTEGEAPRRRRRRPEPKRKKKMSPARRLLTIALTVLAIYLIALGIFTLAAHLTENPDDKPMDVLKSVIGGEVPERTSFLVMCTDEDGSRTDTIMVGCYNSKTGGLDVISIPRDTMVSVSAANFELMQEDYPQPGNPEMQINHIHHFTGEEKGPQILKEEVEGLLDIEINYYVRVDFDAFRYFVDSIGGVEFNVPQNMDYDDPAQDLAIHLEKGSQLLDGEKAEQLVRFRQNNDGTGYAMGDIDRIGVQQEFLKALVKKALSADTITSNTKAYINTFFKYITTNASVTDVIKYSSELDKIDISKMNTYILPGEAYNRYYYDPEETEALAYNIFKRPSEEILAEQAAEANGTAPTDSKAARIQVLNGGYTNGKAGDVRDTLMGEGYDVEDIDTYSDTKHTETRIYVNQKGLGEDLIPYFNSAEVINDSRFTDEYDIVIVIGTEE